MLVVVNRVVFWGRVVVCETRVDLFVDREIELFFVFLMSRFEG